MKLKIIFLEGIAKGKFSEKMKWFGENLRRRRGIWAVLNFLFTLWTFKQKEFSGRRGGGRIFTKKEESKDLITMYLRIPYPPHSPLGVGIASLDLKDVVSLPYRSSAIKLTLISLLAHYSEGGGFLRETRLNNFKWKIYLMGKGI